MGAMSYFRYSDNVAPNGTWAVDVGTELAQYEADKIADQVLARPAKIVEVTGAWKVDFGSAQRIDAILLPMHNIDAGLAVTIQGNATDSWGSPTLSEPIVIPTYRLDGFPVGSWLDITGASGYSAGGFQWWRLNVSGTNTNPLAIGELLMFPIIRTFSPNINWGLREIENRGIIEHKTDFGVSSLYDLGVTRRILQGEFDSPDSQRADLEALYRDAKGRTFPFGLVPDNAVNDALVVRLQDTQLETQLVTLDRQTFAVGFEELSRGLVL